jgi:hypothetical protein
MMNAHRSRAMSQKLSRQQLIAITKKLLAGKVSSAAETNRLLQQFEDNVPYHYGADLIVHYRHEFKNAAELVDFALGQEKVKKLSRAELIAIAKRLMSDHDVPSDVETERLGRQFDGNVPHPDGIGLIFYPKIEFKTAEDLVDYALAYQHPKA